MEHLPPEEEPTSVDQHITRNRLITFFKIFLIVAFVAIAFCLSISTIKFVLFPEIKDIQKKLIQFSACLDDIQTLKKEKALWHEEFSKIQEEIGDLRQSISHIHQNPQAPNDQGYSSPLIKSVENSTESSYIGFIHALRKRADFDEAFKKIAHLKLGPKRANLTDHLKKIYTPEITYATLQKDFAVLYSTIKKNKQETKTTDVFQRIKNYFMKNIHVSFKDNELFLSTGSMLEKAKKKMEKKDINGALSDILTLKSLEETKVWIKKATIYLQIEKLIERLNQLDEGFEP